MGQPKTWLPVDGEPMLCRVVRLVAEAANPVVVVAADGQPVPMLPADVRVVRDECPGRGPLQGLVAGLSHLRGEEADAVYVSACDAPFLQPAVVRKLASLLGDHAACVPRIDGQLYPLAAVYRVGVEDEARRMLGDDLLAVRHLLTRVPTREVTADELRDVDPLLESFRNVNTPDAYEHEVRQRGQGTAS